jgi:O-antigen ligase
LTAIFVVVLMVIPARLVLKGVPLALAPSMLIGFGLGACWLCAQMVTTTGVAKGRNTARTALFLFACSQLATYGYATYGYLPRDELNATDRSLLTILAVVAVGITVCDGVTRVERLERLLKVMVGACTFMAGVAILQFLGLDIVPYLTLPGLRPAVDGTDFVLQRGAFPRPAGTAGHPIELGVVCSAAAPLALHLAWGRTGTRPAWAWWGCLAILLIATMVSLSRSGILGLAVAFLVLLPTWPARRQFLTLAGAVLFAGAMSVAIRGLIGTLIGLFVNITDDSSIQTRTNDYKSAFLQISMHPWLGRGLGTYLPNKYGALDNQYLGTIVQNGYVGLAVLIVLLLAGMYACTRARLMLRDPVQRDMAQSLLAAIAVIALTAAFFDMFAFGTVTGVMFVLIGMSGALLRIAYRMRADSDSSARGGLAAQILRRLRKARS